MQRFISTITNLVCTQGCCFSLFSRDDGAIPYSAEVTEEHPHGDSSSPTVNPITDAIVSEAAGRHRTTGAATTTTTVRRRGAVPLSEHYNQPIRPHTWRSKRRTWSHAQLARERQEFFETRVTGRQEVWAALASATALMRDGDFATAQSIIDAAGITVPTGDLCEGCYDETGALYRLPQCIVSDPDNIVDSPADGIDNDAISDGKLGADEASEDELIPDDIERRREEKGKTSERDLIKVKARLSDREGPDLTISIGKTQSVGLLARKVQGEAGISGRQRVRLAYLGRILNEHESLTDQGWKNGHIVNALVVTRRSIS
ncbi:ubiquitin domain protein [Paecilomyces variotii]|uniref:Ubiquitin domain protein n=1 Tax=Byssochlamys spectabilis TaxID=264951 RepID=A0A443HV46_BYSSP|nr:ubiquitin domain protein [Paecilomyces variotii]RWQ95707.1 ubiquitin domain protein [Paecilomyces variotii]